MLVGGHVRGYAIYDYANFLEASAVRLGLTSHRSKSYWSLLGKQDVHESCLALAAGPSCLDDVLAMRRANDSISSGDWLARCINRSALA